MIWFNSLYIFLFCMSYVCFSMPPSIQELYNDYVCLIRVHDETTSLIKIPCEKFNDTNMIVLHENNNNNERYADQALEDINTLAEWCRLQEHGCFCLQADELGEADHERLYRIFLGIVKPFASFFIKVDKDILIDRVYFIPTYLFMECPIEAYRLGKVTRDIEVPLLEDIFDGDLGHIKEQPAKEGRMYLFAKRYGSYILAQYFIAYKKISGWWKSLSLPTFKVPS